MTGRQGDVAAQVVRYYDTHPINEEQILRSLAARGVALDGLTEDVLCTLDQDHFGGVEANDLLIARAGIGPGHHVLDVCSGMGGPARYLAHRIGCRVTGLDLTESRHASAQRLTALVGLADRVDFRLGSALDMPFSDASFDAVIGQEAWCHVPDKPRLVAECVRVVRPGGVVAFTDILRRAGLGDDDAQRLAREMSFPVLESAEGYRALLEGRGCVVESVEDLSALWARILQDRLAMYRSLGDETERRFGRARSEEWDQAYAFFVGCYGRGVLGGARIVARRR